MDKAIKASKARTLFENRPYLHEGEITLNKPIVTVGEVPDRSALSYRAEQAGADGVIYNDVYDNGYDLNQVILGFKNPEEYNIKLASRKGNSNISPEEAAGIPKGERNQPENPPLQYFTEGDFTSIPLLGKGEEALAYNKGDRVFKILRKPLIGHSLDFNFNEVPFTPSRIGTFHRQYINPRNNHPIFEPINFEGIYTSSEGQSLPVISQRKINTLNAEDYPNLGSELTNMLDKYGYKLNTKGVYDSYENKYGSISDLHERNLGRDLNGNLRVFDATAGKIDYDAFELSTAKIKQNSYLKTFEEYLQQNPKDL